MANKKEVMVIPQEFTETEKEIARNNIGAVAPTGTSTYQLKGEWEVGVAYVVNDFCTFGGNLYICKNAYMSDPLSDNPSIDTTHWEIFFSGSSKKEVMVIPQEFTETEKEIARNNIGAVAPTGSSNKGVYEFTVTKVLDGTGTEIWDGSGLTADDISETFVNCTSATCPIHIVLNSYGGLKASLAAGYNSITCISHTYVSPNANFANELGMWGFDNLCQVVAGMNRTWFLQHNSELDQNGVRSTTQTAKSGKLTIKFDFVFDIL